MAITERNEPELKALTGSLDIKDEATGEVEAIIATLNVVDKDEDVITGDAIKSGSKVKMSSYGHDVVGFLGAGSLPVGRGAVYVEDGKVVFRGKVFTATERGRDTITVLKEMGKDQEWSFGYRVLGSEEPSDEWRRKGARRVLTRLDVFEVSPVLVGAGRGTHTVSAKECESCRQHAPQPKGSPAELQELAARFAAISTRHAETPEQLDARVAAGIEAFKAQFGSSEPDEVRVNPELRHAAAAHTGWAAARLGIVPPTVKFFSRSSAQGRKNRGLYYDNDHTIWLRSDLAGWELVATVTHETVHAARGVYGMGQSESEVNRETEELVSIYAREAFYGRR